MDDFKKLLEKIEAAKGGRALDLSLDEDLSIAVMNLVSIEEHFFFTGEKTGNSKYFDLLKETREIRKDLLKKLIGEPEGEVWCLSKHLLAASMRLLEVGTKANGKGENDKAKEFFDKAYKLYVLFWAINLNVVDVSGVNKIDDGAINANDKEKDGVNSNFNQLLAKLLDCCGE